MTQSAGSLDTIPAVAIAGLVLAAVLFDVRTDVRRLLRGRNVVLGAVGAWYLVEAIMPSGDLLSCEQTAYDFALSCVALVAVGFLISYEMTSGPRFFAPVAVRFRSLDEPGTLWKVVLACAGVGFAPVAYYSGLQLPELFEGILGMRRTWGGLIGRGRYGDFRASMLMLEIFVLGIGPFAVIMLFDRRSSLFRKIVCAAIAAWPLLRAYGSGTRSLMITAFLPVLAVPFLKSPARMQRRLLVVVLLSLPFVFHFMAAVVGSRPDGQLSWEGAGEATEVGHEMFSELVFITSNVPDPVEYQMGYSYYVQLVNPIPRFLWPGKPTLETGVFMAQLTGEFDVLSGETTLTRAPGLIGEMYLNFGLVGVVVLGVLGGWVVRGWDRIPDHHGDSLAVMVLHVSGLATLFVLGRGFNVGTFYYILFPLAMLCLLRSKSDNEATQGARVRASHSSAAPTIVPRRRG